MELLYRSNALPQIRAALWCFPIRKLRWASICLFLLVAPAQAQSDINLKGAIDFRAHTSPDSMERSIDADDMAKLAKDAGMRGIVLKNHWESTAALAYMVRKEVPGLEVFGGIVLDKAVGGINLEAVKRMSMMKGGYGRVVWFPTVDAEAFVNYLKIDGPTVPVSQGGHLLPSVLEVIDFIAKNHQLVMQTGHVSEQESIMLVHDAHQRGVAHIVVTNPMGIFTHMTIPEIQAATQEGAYIEFTYNSVLPPHPQLSIEEYANGIRQIGPKFCVLGTDFGGMGRNEFHPQGLLDFMVALHKQGISVDDINLMAKTNPARILELQP
jgi:hypothetical protein